MVECAEWIVPGQTPNIPKGSGGTPAQRDGRQRDDVEAADDSGGGRWDSAQHHREKREWAK